MTLQNALKGSLASYAVLVTLFGTGSTLGLRILYVIGWTLGWLACSLIWLKIKERS